MTTSHAILISLFLTICPTKALAAEKPVRLHGILFAGDNWPWDEQAQKFYLEEEMVRSAEWTNDRDLEVMHKTSSSISSPSSKKTQGNEPPVDRVFSKVGAPLESTTRDVIRMEQLLRAYTSPDFVTALVPSPAKDPQGTPPHQRSSLANVEKAFSDTTCRLALLKGKTVLQECVGITVPHEMKGDFNDVVFVHFAGHGSSAGLALKDKPLYKAEFERLVDGLGADLVVVVLDACHGSELVTGESPSEKALDRSMDVPSLVSGRKGLAVFAAASVVPERRSLHSGILTHVMVSALSGAADVDGSGTITFMELADFFTLNTREARQFVSVAQAPGNDLEKVLFDKRAPWSEANLVRLELDGTSLRGRVLIADDDLTSSHGNPYHGGALAEAHLSMTRDHLELAIPLPAPDAKLRIDFLPIPYSDGMPRVMSNSIAERYLRSPGQEFFEIEAAKSDPLANYLASSQEATGLFSRSQLNLAESLVALGTGYDLSLSVFGGLHIGPVYGRFESGDLTGLDETQKAMVLDFEKSQQSTWALPQVATAVRWHPFRPWQVRSRGIANWWHVEGRASFGWDTSTQVETRPSSLGLARAEIGLGSSAYLGSRSTQMRISGGLGKMIVKVKPFDESMRTKTDATPWSGFLSTGLVLQSPWSRRTPFEIDAVLHRDFVVLNVGRAETENASYWTGSISLGMVLGRWSL